MFTSNDQVPGASPGQRSRRKSGRRITKQKETPQWHSPQQTRPKKPVAFLSAL
jgi:hypothetical protein